MYKILELTYNLWLLEEYINKSWYTFVWFIQDKMIFKYKEETTKQLREKTNTEKFFELDNIWLSNYAWLISERLWLDFNFTLNELEKFRDYRLEKSENAIKCKWQKQNSFEVPKRLKTRFSNNNKPKKSATITEI